MLFRSVLSGVVLGLFILAIFLVVIDRDCGSALGCVNLSRFSETVEAVVNRFTGDGNAAKLTRTKQIPALMEREEEAAPNRAPQLARKLALPRVSKPAAQVDSLGAEGQYDILKWNLVAYRAGNVDEVRAEHGHVSKDGRLTLSKGDRVLLSGWAGHPAYGVRFRDVLFSLCGKVVGRASIQGARADVARAVHRNLGSSGWAAKLAADHLPRCKEQVLQAWGVAPIGYNIFPLSGKTVLSFTGTAGPVAGFYRTQLAPLTPAKNGKALLRKIKVRASAVRLRKCGDSTCDVVGKIPAGLHEGFVLETTDGWTLFQIGDAVGWANDRFHTIQ